MNTMVQLLNLFFRRLTFGSKGHIKELKAYSVQVFSAKLAIYIILKGREMFADVTQSKSPAYNCG